MKNIVVPFAQTILRLPVKDSTNSAKIKETVEMLKQHIRNVNDTELNDRDLKVSFELLLHDPLIGDGFGNWIIRVDIANSNTMLPPTMKFNKTEII